MATGNSKKSEKSETSGITEIAEKSKSMDPLMTGMVYTDHIKDLSV